MEMHHPGVRQLMDRIARRDFPEIEFTLSTSVFMITTDLLRPTDVPRKNDLTMPRVDSWFSNELSHEQWLELLRDELRSAASSGRDYGRCAA